jgi:flagellar assembly factor FliW
VSLAVGRDTRIIFPNGLLGFPEQREFFFDDPGEGSLILWLRSTGNASICFPVLEPRVFSPQFQIKLSAVDVRELKMSSVDEGAVFCILTVPNDVAQMTANLRAPLVINVASHVGKQVVLQDNELSLKHPMYRELRAHQKMFEPAAKPQGDSAESVSVALQRLTSAKGMLSL